MNGGGGFASVSPRGRGVCAPVSFKLGCLASCLGVLPSFYRVSLVGPSETNGLAGRGWTRRPQFSAAFRRCHRSRSRLVAPERLRVERERE